MQSLTLPENLTAIECYDGKIHFKDCTLEYASQFRKAQFQSIDGAIIAWSNIREIRTATDIEYYEYFILPKCSVIEKEFYRQVRSTVPEKMEKTIKLQQILFAVKTKLQEHMRFENDKPFTEEQLARRRKQAENRKRLSYV